MKTFGKIKDFDGYNGTIKGIDGKEYLLMKKEIIPPQELHENDKVCFEPEHFETVETEEDIARFVKKLEKKSK
ncbi:MAG: hypothetical protein II625_03340 [Bacilli bacterium]|nr:hypothetical protein [Bacilli bacterium]